jgi:hypothetical protein
MKKTFLVLGSLIVALSIAGCSTNNSALNKLDSVETSTAQPTSTPETQDSVINADESTSNVVTYSKQMSNSIKKYFSKYTYAVIKQEVSNGTDVNNPQTRAYYTITVDTKSKFTELKYVVGKKVKVNTLYDYKNNKIYIKKKKKWVKTDGKYTVLDWNLNKFKSIYDVYNYLLGENTIAVGTEGVSDGSTYTFSKSFTKVKKSALSGVEYDSLDKQTVLLALKYEKKKYIPISNLVDIAYTKDGYKFYCRTSFSFKSLSSKKSLKA